MIMVTADETLATRATSVRFFAPTPDGLATDIITVTGRDISPDGSPVQIPLFPQDGDLSRGYTVTVELLDESDEAPREVMTHQTLSGDYVENEFREVWMHFGAACEHVRCPAGYRCQSGECVEYCVEPREPGSTEPSGPVACGTPCADAGCFDDRDIAQCQDGAKVLERQCGFGCDDEDSCHQMIPSNVGEYVSWNTDITLGEFVVGAELNGVNTAVAVFNTDLGVAVVEPSANPFGFLCGGLSEDLLTVIPCGDVDGDFIDFECVGADGGECGPVPAEGEYGVFLLDRLVVLEGTSISAVGGRPLILMVNDTVIVEGDVSVSASGIIAGVAGGGGGEPGQDGEGPGHGFADVGNGAGGGASYGGLGGEGAAVASPSMSDVVGGGGAAGALQQEDNMELTPLIGGSGGGGGVGESILGRGGGGGGALQISTNGYLVIGPRGVIAAAGGGGTRGTWPEEVVEEEGIGGSGGGGGSGGALLLEAGQLSCVDPLADEARIGAPGGGGGSGSVVPQVSQGANGDPRQVPAAGDPTYGGSGSDDLGNAEAGTGLWFFAPNAGGGGGGAGRVRINTQEPMTPASYEPVCGALLQSTSFGAATVAD